MTEPTRTQRRSEALVDVYIESIPPLLRRALEQAANDSASSLNAVAVAVIAEEFGYSYTPTGRRSGGKRSRKDFLYLTMPRRLRMKINERAARTEVPAADIIKTILAHHFLT